MIRRITTLVLALVVITCMTGCTDKASQKPEVHVFIAASLAAPMEELESAFEKENEDVDIVLTADSSGILMTQIEEGAEADIFFSAAQKQMDELEDKGYIEDDTRENLVKNKLCVITGKDSKTECKGIDSLGKARELAIADGSVPAGKYTRKALISLGYFDKESNPEEITTKELQEILGTEISEQSNVTKVLLSVAENASEVGTVYYSDTYGYDEKIRILEMVSEKLTGEIIYPAAQVVNSKADDAQKDAAKKFLEYLKSDEAKKVYEKYYMEAEI